MSSAPMLAPDGSRLALEALIAQSYGGAFTRERVVRVTVLEHLMRSDTREVVYAMVTTRRTSGGLVDVLVTAVVLDGERVHLQRYADGEITALRRAAIHVDDAVRARRARALGGHRSTTSRPRPSAEVDGA